MPQTAVNRSEETGTVSLELNTAGANKPTTEFRFVSILLVAICMCFMYYIGVLKAVHYSPWAQFSYLGMWLLYLCSSPKTTEIIFTAFLGIFLTRFGGFTSGFAYPGGPIVTAGAYVGVVSVLALAWRAPRDLCARKMLFRCFALLGMGIGIDRLLALNAELVAWKLDQYLYALDLRLIGWEPGFWLAATKFYSYLRPTQLFLYYSLPFATMLVYAGHIRHSRPRGTNFLLIAIGNLTVGYAAYLFYPAAGPVYAFPALFPHGTPLLAALQPQLIAAPANAMPSLHVSAALLMWWNSRHWRVAQHFSLAFLILTVLATIGLGEHYIIDLIVAVPYALFIQALGTRRDSRLTCLLVGLAMTVTWIVLLRYGFSFLMGSSFLLRSMAALTLCIPMWLANRLLRPVSAPPPPTAT